MGEFVDYLRGRPHPVAPLTEGMEPALESLCEQAAHLTELLEAVYEKRRQMLQFVAESLSPYHVGDILERVFENRASLRYVVTTLCHCRSDWSAPYLVRVRVLMKDGSLSARETFLDVTSAPKIEGRFEGEFPPSDWVDDQRI